MIVSYSDFFSILIYNRKNEQCIQKCLTLCEERAGKSFSPKELSSAKEKLRKMKANFDQRWNSKAVNRTQEKFLTKYPNWANGTLELIISGNDNDFEVPQQSPGPGRATKSYAESSERSQSRKRKHATDTLGKETELFLGTAAKTARMEGKRDLAKILEILMQSDINMKALVKLLENQPEPLSPIEMLSLYVDADLTQDSFQLIRNAGVNQNADIFPSYHVVLATKKDCYPDGIEVSATTVEVPMEALIDHTIRRTLIAYEPYIEKHCERLGQEIHAVFTFTAGQDGTSNQHRFNQRLDLNPNDGNLFIVQVNPLGLITDAGKTIYVNLAPQSTRSVRPQKMIFVKENASLNREEHAKATASLDHLRENYEHRHMLSTGQQLVIKFDYEYTLCDGLVCSNIYELHTTKCFVCSAPMLFMNKYEEWQLHPEFKLNESALRKCARPVHQGIGLFDGMCKLSAKLFLEKTEWQVRGEENKKIYKKRFEAIQTQFIERMNLRVGFPTIHGGSSTNGPVAKFALDHSDVTADILSINEELVGICSLLNKVCRSFYFANVEEVEKLCKRGYELWKTHYPHIPMNARTHWTFVHLPACIRLMKYPLGYYSEECSEANNKLIRSDRVGHARGDTREHNFEDVFHAALIRSDPLVSSIGILKRQLKKKKHVVTPELRKLLIIPENVTEIELVDE